VVGQREDTLNKQRKDFERGYRKIKDSYDAGAPDRNNGFKTVWADVTLPATDEAKALEGSYAGFQPKPAVEVVIVAMKPLREKGYTAQAMATGKGVTWLDNCRMPYVSEADKKAAADKNQHENYKNPGSNKDSYSGDYPERHNYDASKGRFPANLLVSDDALNDGNITTSEGGVTQMRSHFGSVDAQQRNGGYGDSGSHSRYFDVDAWWAQQLHDMPDSVKQVFPFLIVPKPSKSEKDKGLASTLNDEPNHGKNLSSSDKGAIRGKLA